MLDGNWTFVEEKPRLYDYYGFLRNPVLWTSVRVYKEEKTGIRTVRPTRIEVLWLQLLDFEFRPISQER